MPDYAAYEELSLVARFGSENERRDESLDDVRMDWQDRTDGDDDDNESHQRYRTLCRRFLSLSEDELISLARQHYPEWTVTVTLTNGIIHEARGWSKTIGPCENPENRFRLPVAFLTDETLNYLLDRADDIDPQELQDLRRDKEWREGLAEYKRARAAIPQAA
jgi:hypothetical protein